MLRYGTAILSKGVVQTNYAFQKYSYYTFVFPVRIKTFWGTEKIQFEGGPGWGPALVPPGQSVPASRHLRRARLAGRGFLVPCALRAPARHATSTHPCIVLPTAQALYSAAAQGSAAAWQSRRLALGAGSRWCRAVCRSAPTPAPAAQLPSCPAAQLPSCHPLPARAGKKKYSG